VKEPANSKSAFKVFRLINKVLLGRVKKVKFYVQRVTNILQNKQNLSQIAALMRIFGCLYFAWLVLHLPTESQLLSQRVS